jgi:hypothetical protein
MLPSVGHNEFQAHNHLIVACYPCLTKAFASIDGLNLLCQTSNNEEIENATYNGWLCEHFVSSVLVFSPQGALLIFSIDCVRGTPTLTALAALALSILAPTRAPSTPAASAASAASTQSLPELLSARAGMCYVTRPRIIVDTYGHVLLGSTYQYMRLRLAWESSSFLLFGFPH